ncbi:NAD-dependent epimerase/dehydratase family protein [Lacrimispora sp.]|uniref:NAD-dependent epimerase/dehydratase family protein n=1 Tax=Lacrimispora sp. TaxID=2719234 RepID=UPI0028B0A9DA|nr:NAD-dependent epimerase/dehydratase family protein [Lacrimispora sp.]
MNNTIYLVTGAAGFLGNNISRLLIEQGKSVRALVLKGDPAAENIPQGVDIVEGDLTDFDSCERFFEVPEGKEVIVIHVASVVAISPEPSELVYKVNVEGTRNIVDLCVHHKVKKLVYISSTGGIPELPAGTLICEPKTSEDFDPDGVMGYYSKTKALATQYVLDAVSNTGLNASVVYPTGICGPDDYAFGPVASVIMKYCRGEMKVGIEGSFNSVDVRDLADGVISCAKNGRAGEGYIMGNEAVTMKQMFELISQTSGAPMVETILSVEAMRAATEKQLPDGPEKEKAMAAMEFSMYNLTRNNNFSSQKAINVLGYKTRPFVETITDEVRWLQSLGKI